MSVLAKKLNNIQMVVNRIKSLALRHLYYRNPLNIYLAQKIYGNDSGLLANLVGRAVLFKDRMCCRGLSWQGSQQDKVDHLRLKGLVSIEGVDFGDALVNLRQKLDAYCASYEVPDSQRLEASSIGNYQFFDQFPEVKAVLNEKLQAFICDYYSAHFNVLNVHLYRIFPVPTSQLHKNRYRPYGATGCWHNDGSTVESIKMFVLIDDVEEDQGPMHVIAADETESILAKKYFKYTRDGLPDAPFEKLVSVKKMTGKAGTVLFANPNVCLHRASVPAPGKSRDMLVFYLTSSSKPLPENWDKKAIYQQSMGLGRLFNIYSKKQ